MPSSSRPSFELRHLRYFVAVAETRSFTEAARLLHMAQPPLSQQMARLEKAHGVRLFDRTARPLALTAVGRVLYQEAKELLERADLVSDRVAAIRGGRGGPLTLAALPSSLYVLLPALLGRYRAAYPDVEVRLEIMPTVQQLEAIRKKHVDAGVIRHVHRPAGMGAMILETNPFVAAVGAAHPLAGRTRIGLSELSGEPFLALERVNGPEYDDLFVGLCNAAGFSPAITRRVEDVHSMLGMVACGLGIALVLDVYREHHLPNLRYIELEDLQPTPLNSYLIWPEPLTSPILDAFLGFTRTFSAGMMKPGGADREGAT